MNTNGLARLYDKLTPRERLPLIVAAVDRGDDVEADRLSRSAPRLYFGLPDYHGLAEGLQLLVLFHLLHLQERAIHYWHCLALLEQDAWLFGDGKKGRPVEDRVENVLRMWAYLFVVEADAWKQLAAELQIDPETLLRDIPCYDTLRQTEEAIRLTAFTEKEATEYLRQRGDQEARPLTVESTLAEMRAFLDSRVVWWE
jgi:hypothetical protein